MCACMQQFYAVLWVRLKSGLKNPPTFGGGSLLLLLLPALPSGCPCLSERIFR